MSHTSYSVGSAFAQALSMANAMIDGAAMTRLPHVVRIELAGYDAEEATVYLRHNPAKARDKLICAAAQLMAVAEALGRRAEVVQLPAGRSHLRVVS